MSNFTQPASGHSYLHSRRHRPGTLAMFRNSNRRVTSRLSMDNKF
ncbi:hypothetical protein ACLK19_16595 [Escherichia coli]